MNTFETFAIVEDQHQVRVAGVPFEPGTEVEVTISLKRRTDGAVTGSDDGAQSGARDRMRELFRTIKGFRMTPRISREELYDRRGLR